MPQEEDKAAQAAMAKRLQQQQLEQQKREILKRFLTTEAFERMANVRISNPELYNRFVELVVSLVQSNRLPGKLNEDQLKDLLTRLTSTREEPTIEFRHK